LTHTHTQKGLEISPRSLGKTVQPNVLFTFIKQPILHIYLGNWGE